MKECEESPKSGGTWTKTRVQSLVRHKKSGRYYARLFEGGKERWKALKTDQPGVAQARLAEMLKERKKRRATGHAAASGKMTVGHGLAIHRRRVASDPRLKPNSVRYWLQTADFLEKTWPDLAGREMRKITDEECQEWAARTAPETSSARFNNTVSLLRGVLKIGVDAGVIYANPADSVSRVKVRQKSLTLPTQAQFRVILDTMSATTKNGHPVSKGGADLAEGLAYTGMRLDEAVHLQWPDLDFEHRETVVRGDPETGTKNSQVRHVPMTDEAAALFERLRDERTKQGRLEGPVFAVQSCRGALARACKVAGAAKITHHDLRHYFATVCIESGVDIPTVSRWLGHKDGGALAMRTYGHLRREHSREAAKKVSFR